MANWYSFYDWGLALNKVLKSMYSQQCASNKGMQWSAATSDALAALRTLMLNGGWDRYWQQREVLPLVAS